MVDVSNIARLSIGIADLRILVITFNRPKSLQRLLMSLNMADYMNDRVILEIWIDKNAEGNIDEETFIQACNFKFEKGQLVIYNHTKSVGIYGQWMDTWRPDPLKQEIAVFMEDDLSVSPYFYRYLKRVHDKYADYQDVNGYSLHVLREKGGLNNAKIALKDIVLLYPILESWGFSPKRDNWIEFIKWYKTVSKNNAFQPFVPGLIQSTWYKKFLNEGKANSMWTMWFIFYAWHHKQYTLYPNFNGSKGFTKNWRETGLHFKKGKQDFLGDPLVGEWDERMEFLPNKLTRLRISGVVNEISDPFLSLIT